jgi:hypothetical protein
MGNAPVGGLPFEVFVPDHSIDHLRRFLHMGLDGSLAKRNQPSENNWFTPTFTDTSQTDEIRDRQQC